MRNRNWLISLILGGCLLFSLFSSAVTAVEPEVVLSTTIVRPGDFFQIKVQAAHQSLVRVMFQGGSKMLPESDPETFIGLLAVSDETDPDFYPLGVEITKDQNVVTALYRIQVIERKFPEDRVTMDEKIQKTIFTSSNQEADSKKTQEVRQKAAMEAKLPLWRGPFIWPVKGPITTEFGFTRYINNIPEGRHSGIDIAASQGTPVLATNDGRVVFAGKLYLTGWTVIIHHGLDLYSSYGHLSAIKVQEGENVVKGDLIGLVGSTGLATGPHVHFTFKIGEIAVDPHLFLDQEVGWKF